MKSAITLFLLLFSAATIAAPEQAATSNQSKAQVLVFWASWCPACKPLLKDLSVVEKTLNDAGASIKAVSLDNTSNKSGLTDANHDHVKVLKEQYQVRALPWVVLVDGNGEVLSVPSEHHSPNDIANWLEAEVALNM